MKYSAVAFLLLSTFLHATTINVPADYSSIQAALNAAVEGDTVLVQPGTYYENIMWPDVNGIKLISAGDSSNTVIDGGGISSVIYMNPVNATIDTTTVVRGFEITNGGNISNGSGIFIHAASPTLTSLLISNNMANLDGGGMYLSNATPTLTDVTLNGNTAFGRGGGIFVDSTGYASWTRVTLSSNTGTIGGGAYLRYSNLSLLNVTATGNTGGQAGGGFYLDNSDPTFAYVDVNNNIAQGGGGLYLDYSDPSLSNVTVSGNVAWMNNRSGGGLNIHYSDPMLVDVTVSGNTTVWHGGGIYINGGNPTLIDVTVTENEARNGGGISYHNCAPSLTNITVTNNTATEDGGGIYVGYVGSGSSSLTGINVSGNTANADGGGIYISNATPTLTDVSVYDNIGGNGGGIYFHLSNAVLTSVNVSRNTGGSVGGLYLYNSDAILTDVIVADNNGVSVGGLIIFSSNPKLTSVTVAGNSGKGLYFQSSSGGTILNATITGNASGLYIESGTPSIASSNIAFNGVGLHNADNLNIIDADSAWWGHSSGPHHSSQNPTGQGDSVNAFVNVTPWLTTPDITAPPIPAQNLITTVTGNDYINLSWDSSPLSDFAGFKLYYDSDLSGYPYANTIDVGTDTSYSLTGLLLGTTFYLSVTCYDTDGNESWYSNEVVATTRVLEAQNLDIGNEEDQQHLTSHTPSIKWDYYDSMAEPQAHYHAQVSSLADFSTIDLWDSGEIASSADSIVYAGNAPTDGVTYHLRVKVSADGFWSGWSSIEFRMNTAPSAPTSLHPINNEVVTAIPALGITNSTDAEEDAITYRFDLYEDAGLTTRLDSALYVAPGTDTTSWTVSVVLPDNGQYWWTVIAHDGYESSILAGPNSFLVNTENNVPGAFSLVSPEINGSVSTLTPTFSWTAAFDPDPLDTVKYSLAILTPEPALQVIDADTAITVQILNPLIDNTRYHWRVIARDLLGFETISDGDFQPFVVNAGNDPPSPVSLISPDSVKVLDLTPLFYWTAATDPDPNDSIYYYFQFAPVSVAHMIVIVDMYLDTNSVTLEDDLSDNRAYWWTVNSIDRAGSITQTDTAIFWTDLFPESPGFFATVSPAMDAQGLAPNVVFEWQPAIDPDPLDLVNYSLGYATEWTDSITYTWMHGIVDTTVVISLENNTEYLWIVEAKDSDGQVTVSNDGSIMRFVVGSLSIDDLPVIPEDYALHQNYPNPFNPTSTIRYDLPESANVTLVIYDILGREVIRLVNQEMQPGYHRAVWEAKDHTGRVMPTGIYIARLTAPEYSKSIKMLLLK